MAGLGIDLIYEGIATQSVKDHVGSVLLGIDLIYEGIATVLIPGIFDCLLFILGIDLIYEGIATWAITSHIPE